jgi:hypothetical protein
MWLCWQLWQTTQEFEAWPVRPARKGFPSSHMLHWGCSVDLQSHDRTQAKVVRRWTTTASSVSNRHQESHLKDCGMSGLLFCWCFRTWWIERLMSFASEYSNNYAVVLSFPIFVKAAYNKWVFSHQLVLPWCAVVYSDASWSSSAVQLVEDNVKGHWSWGRVLCKQDRACNWYRKVITFFM